MKLFKCQACGQLLHFENHACERCGHRLGYLPDTVTVSVLEPDSDTTWRALAQPGSAHRFCANAEFDSSNWLVPATAGEAYCTACRHNGVIPNASDPANLAAWRVMEQAKYRLFYTLLQLRLPLKTRAEDPEHGLVFEFLAEPRTMAPR
ncbi:putative zinc-binding metallopeptidase [Microvirga ossetica]|nr:putative zinc-binding metallopeptidase [Microvirga ossetica]